MSEHLSTTNQTVIMTSHDNIVDQGPPTVMLSSDLKETPTTIEQQQQQLISELRRKKDELCRLNKELFHLQHTNQTLSEQSRVVHDRMIQRQKDQQQLLDNYADHIRSRRATDDTPQTIHQKLQQLKDMIHTVSAGLTQRCESMDVATKAITSFWVNLHDAIAVLGTPLPPHRMCLLVEKFIMDVLIQNMNYNAFVGLSIASPYRQLQTWFEQHESSFCTRFRQAIAHVAVVASSTTTTTTTQDEIQKFNKKMYISLHTSLRQAFPNMDCADTLMEMVELSSQIGYAMRGQETDIAAVAVGEGSEQLDPHRMIDVDGNTSGVIQLCISPPFIMYGTHIEILEKARVLCY